LQHSHFSHASAPAALRQDEWCGEHGMHDGACGSIMHPMLTTPLILAPGRGDMHLLCSPHRSSWLRDVARRGPTGAKASGMTH